MESPTSFFWVDDYDSNSQYLWSAYYVPGFYLVLCRLYMWNKPSEKVLLLSSQARREQLRMDRTAQKSHTEICEYGLYHGGLEGSRGF